MKSDFPQGTLNSTQLEILKLFTRDLKEEDLIEIKRIIVRYLANRIKRLSDQKWDENNWSDDDMERMLKKHNRTPYDSKNQ
jgi:hypothetical protein